MLYATLSNADHPPLAALRNRIACVLSKFALTRDVSVSAGILSYGYSTPEIID